MDIDDKTRQSIQQQFKALDTARDALELAMKPFRDADSAILEARELLLEHYEIEIAGTCESCDKLLFEGDQGHRDDEGIMLCAAHSPTWADAEKSWQEALEHVDEDDPERRQAFDRALAAHLAAGGRRDDKLTHAL
jgi:hypothetical protein